ncbi:MAG: hypothetical protein ACREBI_05445 [Nitrosotalea sp.]
MEQFIGINTVLYFMEEELTDVIVLNAISQGAKKIRQDRKENTN